MFLRLNIATATRKTIGASASIIRVMTTSDKKGI